MSFRRTMATALGGLAAGLWALLSGGPASAADLAQLAPVRPVMDCAALAGADFSQSVGAKVTVRSAKVFAGAGQAYCGVRGEIAPHIGFEVRLPMAGWTQRYLQLGCGGLCGVIAIRPEHASACVPVTSGAVVLASTDMGHAGSMGSRPVGRPR